MDGHQEIEQSVELTWSEKTERTDRCDLSQVLVILLIGQGKRY